MHKILANEAILDLAIVCDNSPILIKSGETGGLDPTHPDMEFIRMGGQIFLPGSSLKGVIRAQSERIVRLLQPETPKEGKGACDPLNRAISCGFRLERESRRSHEQYRESCFICRLFGSTVVASRVRFADALPKGELTIEERNGVAIDRVYGSVAVGPFNYEVVTKGTFTTKIVFKNFTLAQFALVGLALRDIHEGYVRLGFAKSRGMGRVTVNWDKLTIRYPMHTLRGRDDIQATDLCGAGKLIGSMIGEYGDAFPSDDSVTLPADLKFEDDGWSGWQMEAQGKDQVIDVFKATISRWKQEVGRGR